MHPSSDSSKRKVERIWERLVLYKGLQASGQYVRLLRSLRTESSMSTETIGFVCTVTNAAGAGVNWYWLRRTGS